MPRCFRSTEGDAAGGRENANLKAGKEFSGRKPPQPTWAGGSALSKGGGGDKGGWKVWQGSQGSTRLDCAKQV